MRARLVLSLGVAMTLLTAPIRGASDGVDEPKTFGTGVSLSEVTPIARLLEAPAAFEGKTVRVEGTVTAVCAHMGCWMALAPTDTTAATSGTATSDAVASGTAASGTAASGTAASGTARSGAAGSGGASSAMAASAAKGSTALGSTASPTLRLKVDDGVIVFPVSAKGHRAAAQGVMERVKTGDAEGNEAAGEHARAEGKKPDAAAQWHIKVTGAVVY